MNDNSLKVEYHCPQCGAPKVLDEADRMFTCDFCRVGSYLFQKDYFRYLIPPANPDRDDLIYAPYWRFRGTVFSCTAEGTDQRFLDDSRLACSAWFFPGSLGFRAQALQLKMLDPAMKGRFIAPAFSMEHVLEMFREQLSFPPGGTMASGPAVEERAVRQNVISPSKETILLRSFLGESLSMVYAPFYVDSGELYDAVLERPIASGEVAEKAAQLENRPPEFGTRFLATLCPSCGWDLDGDSVSLAVTCPHCRSVWQAHESGFKEIAYAYVPADWPEPVYLPFWRIKADVAGVRLKSFADLIRVANLPMAQKPRFEKVPFSFWVPAFRTRPVDFLNLSHRFILSQPDKNRVNTIPEERLFPVSVSIADAARSLKLHLFNLIRPRRRAITVLHELNVKPKRYKLIYVPFQEGPHQLIREDVNIGISKTMLAYFRKFRGGG